MTCYWRVLIHCLTLLFESNSTNKCLKVFDSERPLLNHRTTTILNPMIQPISVFRIRIWHSISLYVGKWLCRHVCMWLFLIASVSASSKVQSCRQIQLNLCTLCCGFKDPSIKLLQRYWLILIPTTCRLSSNSDWGRHLSLENFDFIWCLKRCWNNKMNANVIKMSAGQIWHFYCLLSLAFFLLLQFMLSI